MVVLSFFFCFMSNISTCILGVFKMSFLYDIHLDYFNIANQLCKVGRMIVYLIEKEKTASSQNEINSSDPKRKKKKSNYSTIRQLQQFPWNKLAWAFN